MYGFVATQQLARPQLVPRLLYQHGCPAPFAASEACHPIFTSSFLFGTTRACCQIVEAETHDPRQAKDLAIRSHPPAFSFHVSIGSPCRRTLYSAFAPSTFETYSRVHEPAQPNLPEMQHHSLSTIRRHKLRTSVYIPVESDILIYAVSLASQELFQIDSRVG